MTNVYSDLAHHYRTFSLARWIILGLIVLLFWAYVSEKREDLRHWKLDVYRYHPSSESGDRIMFANSFHVDIHISPGHHEPENLEPRVLVCPTIDFSGSLNDYVDLFPPAFARMVQTLSKRTVERLRAELACCAFDTNVHYQDYAPAPFYLETPLRYAGGGRTALGTALVTVIEQTLRRREELKQQRIGCYRSICPVITDGGANDGNVIEDAIREVRRAEQREQIEFIPLAPHPDCIADLEAIFGEETVLLLPEVDFDKLFAALTQTVSSYSQSTRGFEPKAGQLMKESVERAYGTRSLLPPPPTRQLRLRRK